MEVVGSPVSASWGIKVTKSSLSGGAGATCTTGGGSITGGVEGRDFVLARDKLESVGGDRLIEIESDLIITCEEVSSSTWMNTSGPNCEVFVVRICFATTVTTGTAEDTGRDREGVSVPLKGTRTSGKT
jgi:hypothetical protein